MQKSRTYSSLPHPPQLRPGWSSRQPAPRSLIIASGTVLQIASPRSNSRITSRLSGIPQRRAGRRADEAFSRTEIGSQGAWQASPSSCEPRQDFAHPPEIE